MDAITFKNTTGTLDYVEKLAARLQSGEAAVRLRHAVMHQLVRVTFDDLRTNQCEYSPGVTRWASLLLSEMEIICRNYANSLGNGMGLLGYSRMDLRCIRALACLEAMVRIGIRDTIISRCGPIGLKERAIEAYEQLVDYLKWKSMSRESVKAKLLRAEGPNHPHDVYARRANTYGISREEAKAMLYKTLYSNGYGETNKPNEGDSNMTLGVEISNPNARPVAPAPHRPFDFSKPAIIDIKHVYGVPVEQLTLNSITTLLTERQEAVEQLKSLPHKPEVIKKQISDLKKDIAALLALANELFPVAE